MKNPIPKLAICMLIVFNLSTFAQNKVVFNYTGSDQSYTVPAGVTQITVKAWGAGGAGGNYVFNDYGGGGGYATGVINVTPGDVLKVIVGGGGKRGKGPGAYGGGGAKSGGYASYGGRGGGRSAIRNSSDVELLTAGAGGGGGGSDLSNHAGAGGGGGYVGGYGNFGSFDGQPGTQTAGGIGGHHYNGCTCGGHPGSQFLGGNATAIDNGYNGSGGGGYYGGGSGTDYGDGGGGGGSSYVPAGGCTVGATDFNAANNTDPHYKNSAGLGGQKGVNGKNGRVVLILYGFCSQGTPVPISAYGACDGSISFDTLGGTPPYTFLWSDGYTSGARNNICPGIYFITITDALGCNKTVKRKWFDPAGGPATALNFNSGVFSYSSYINCGNSPLLQINNQITVEAWVKPAPGAHRIMGKYDNDLASGWRLYQDGSHFIFGVSSGTDHDLVSSVAYSNNQWYHVAGTYNKNTGVLAIYVNGVITQETNYNNGILLNTEDNFWIGAFMAWGFNGFVGSLDEVRIWNTIRTSNELNQYSNCELTGSESGLVAYYKFNQGIASGNNAGVTTLIDATSNGLNGTLISFALTGSTSNWVSPGAVSGNCATFLSLSFTDASSKYCPDGSLTATIDNFSTDSNSVFTLYDSNNNIIATWNLNTDNNPSHTFTNLTPGLYAVVAASGNTFTSKSGNVKGSCTFSFNDVTIDSITGCSGQGSPNNFHMQYHGLACGSITMQMKYFDWTGQEVILNLSQNGNDYYKSGVEELTRGGVMLIGQNGTCVDSTYFHANPIPCITSQSIGVGYGSCGATISGSFSSNHCNPADERMYVDGITNNIHVSSSQGGPIRGFPDGDYSVYMSDAGCSETPEIITITGATWAAPVNLTAMQVGTSQTVKIEWEDIFDFHCLYGNDFGFQVQVRKQGDINWENYYTSGNYPLKRFKKISNIINDSIYEYRVRAKWYPASGGALWSTIETFCIGTNCSISRIGTETENNNNQIRVQPNPAKDLIKISLDADFDNPVDIKVYDQLGREVIAKSKIDITDDLQLNVSSLNNGLYIISIISEGEKYSSRFIVNR